MTPSRSQWPADGSFPLSPSLCLTYHTTPAADADLLAAAGPEKGEAAQALGLFALFRYLELSTMGPRFDTSGLAALVDWPALLAMAPTRPAQGLVHYCYAGLMHGVDNTVALFPSIDIRPKVSGQRLCADAQAAAVGLCLCTGGGVVCIHKHTLKPMPFFYRTAHPPGPARHAGGGAAAAGHDNILGFGFGFAQRWQR